MLRAQNRLAELSLQRLQPRYPLHCKPHMLHHTFKFLKVLSETHHWCESPLVDATQIDESFVGVISRFSRRVSPRLTVHRTYDIYLASLRRHLVDDDDWGKKKWVEAGWFDRHSKSWDYCMTNVKSSGLPQYNRRIPESCENLGQLRESPDTTGELQEFKKILKFWDSCKNCYDPGLAGIYIYSRLSNNVGV